MEIPSGVITISDNAFDACSYLKSVQIPESVNYIGDRAFYRTDRLTTIEVDAGNQYFAIINGALYTKDGKTLIYTLAK